MNKTLENLMKNLKSNGMEPYFVKTKEQVLPLIKTMLPKGASVALGGSVTLDECGVPELLKNGDYKYFDRKKAEITPEEHMMVMKNSLTADYYISSSNAVTLDGELYNVDGTGNRLAALNFGPDNLIFVVGVNKIVKDIKEADYRVKTVAAPKNAVRLFKNTPCAKTGKCIAVTTDSNHTFNCGCDSLDRICRNYLVLGKQENNGRVKVIICDEALGY